MRFVVGLVAGAAIGVAGAVYYSVKSGRDLREVAGEFVGQVRSELENRDLDSLTSRIEARVGQVQGQVEELVADAQSSAGEAADAAGDTAEDAVAEDAADAAGDAVADTADAVAEGVTDATNGMEAKAKT
jgi:gas vesicle protein